MEKYKIKGGKFNYEKREKIKDNNSPGPGYYKIPCSIRDVPKFVSRQKGEWNEGFSYV